jgi:eukaryotic-like serine/threonine-protein kinase
MVMPATPPTKSSWNLARGDRIAPDRVVQALLGGGERYEAYVVWNERLMTPTVLKVLRPDAAENERARRSMTKEGHVLGRLQHPGLTRIFAMELNVERPFIEIEHVGGPRLSTLLRRHGRLSPEQAFPLGRDLASTLHYLHAEGVLHLDVKPSNIIMGPVPRLIDLSVARPIEAVDRINGFVGTDAYMSPEQADPTRWSAIGTRSDTWGLGATLYEGIAKRTPFPRGRHEAEGMERFPQLVQDPAPLDPARHSAGLVEVIMSTLARDPAARPSMATLFDRFDDLAAIAGVGRVRFR